MTTEVQQPLSQELPETSIANSLPADRDWIPDCWTGEAREIPGTCRFGENVKPWNWLELDAAEAEKLWSLLIGFVAFFNKRYGERPDTRIPPCWAEHGPLVEELTTLMFARWHAFESPQGSVGGAQYWHSYTLPAFFHRLRDWLGDDLLTCQQGRHRNRDEPEPSSNFSWAERSRFIAKIDAVRRGHSCEVLNPEDNVRGVEIPYLKDASHPIAQRRSGQ